MNAQAFVAGITEEEDTSQVRGHVFETDIEETATELIGDTECTPEQRGAISALVATVREITTANQSESEKEDKELLEKLNAEALLRKSNA